MVSVVDVSEIVPFGRRVLSAHPQAANSDTDEAYEDDLLIGSVRKIHLESSSKEVWRVKANKHSNGSEELFISGRTVVWSKHHIGAAGHVFRSFTVESPIQQALWFSFMLPEDPHISHMHTPSSSVPPLREQRGLCIVESKAIRFFCEHDDDYGTSLPFQVSQVWPMQHGLLIERVVKLPPTDLSKTPRKDQQTSHLPVLFSLLHPLDEVAPVICRTGGASVLAKISYMTEVSQHVIFTSDDPPLAVTYDANLGIHSVWITRRSVLDEVRAVCSNTATTSKLPSTSHLLPTFDLDATAPSRSATSGLAKISYSTQSPSFSPIRSFSSKLNSPSISLGASSRFSPAPSSSFVLATGTSFSHSHSHQYSPLSHPGHHRSNVTPTYSKSSPVHLSRTPVSQTTASAYDQSAYSEPIEPLAPDICLDHVWTEAASLQRDGAVSRAAKVFLTSDLCGQRYICYLVLSRHQLRCVKYETSNDGSQLIFGSISILPAKDAVTLKAASLMVLLDVSGTLHLYSGLTKMTSLLALSLCMPMGVSSPRPIGMRKEEVERIDIDEEEGGPKTSSRPASAMGGRFDDDVALLSPVPSERSDSPQQPNNSIGVGELSFNGDGLSAERQTRIVHLSDSVGLGFIMELNDSTHHYGAVPVLHTSSLVGRCLDAVRCVLPREAAMTLTVGWYGHCHGPGTDNGRREWDVFCRYLLGTMGYDEAAMFCLQKLPEPAAPADYSVAKKARLCDDSADEHWAYLTSSRHQSLVSRHQDSVLGLSPVTPPPAVSNSVTGAGDTMTYVDSCAALFSHLPSIFIALHLLYEDAKLSHMPVEEVEDVACLLHMLATDVRCQAYTEYYRREFPTLIFNYHSAAKFSEGVTDQLQLPAHVATLPPNIFTWLNDLMMGRDLPPYPYLPGVNDTTRDVIAMFVAMFGDESARDVTWSRYLRKMTVAGHRAPDVEVGLQKKFAALHSATSPFERVLLLAVQMGDGFFQRLACSVVQPLLEAIYECRQHPKCDWPASVYNLIGREDLAKQCVTHARRTGGRGKIDDAAASGDAETAVRDEDDGMEHLDTELMRFRFPDDLRENEVRRLLQSSRPVKISFVQGHGVSDHDFIEEQERHLYATCIRTMALPVGRGMYTLSVQQPLLTETLPVPKLCLTGKSSQQRMTTIDLSHIDVPANMNHWSLFHNGCAAGLKIAPDSKLPANWIIYNKPGSELTNEHAGFILGLGLNGHLANLSSQTIHDYLSQSHEMTTVALLLGLAASNRGSMDLTTTRALCVHIPALLPVTSVDLDVPHCVQVAAVMGLGLVYESTAHCHFAEVLLNEIGRPACAETDNCLERQSYCLAAGLALGMVLLGRGETLELADLHLTDRLRHYMVGGAKLPVSGIYRDRFKTSSTLTKEGDMVNVDVTAAGATVAIGLMYFNTQNRVIADWLAAPDTMFLLDKVRADLLMLRVISESLVMWDYIHPSEQWIMAHLPNIVARYAYKKAEYANADVDFETINQIYCNILAGACFSMGLKFAGSANQQAYKCLMGMVSHMDRCLMTFSLVEQTGNGKTTIEACLVVMVIAVAMVMAGTGDLDLLRLCRRLRARVGAAYGHVIYGSHMAISMAIGLLLIGGGRYTLSNRPEAVAALLAAFFPKLPIHSNDNRYHLQALRHLYVLAAEPRLVTPRDVDTDQICYVPLHITLKDTEHYSGVSFDVMAPCLLPELSSIKEVTVSGPRYWSMSFTYDKNWARLENLLATSGVMFVKRRVNYLPYSTDPKGFHSQQLQYALVDQASGKIRQELSTSEQKPFNDNIITSYAELFFSSPDRAALQEQPVLRFLSKFLSDAVGNEKTEALATCVYLDKVSDAALHSRSTLGLQQLKLVSVFYRQLHTRGVTADDGGLISLNFLLYLTNRVERSLDCAYVTDDTRTVIRDYLMQILAAGRLGEGKRRKISEPFTLTLPELDAVGMVVGGLDLDVSRCEGTVIPDNLTTGQAQFLAAFLTWHRFPYSRRKMAVQGTTNFLQLYECLSECGLDVANILAVQKMLCS